MIYTSWIEAGKIGVAYFQILINNSIRNSDSKLQYQETTAKSGKKKNPFYSHTKKHWLAAGSGAIVTVSAKILKTFGVAPG